MNNKLITLTCFLCSQLESLLQLWLTLSLNTCSSGSDDSGSDIFLFNASRIPTIPLNQGRLELQRLFSHPASCFPHSRYCLFSGSISSFLSVLAWYPNTSLRTWCLVLHSLTLMSNMPACGQCSTFCFPCVFRLR